MKTLEPSRKFLLIFCLTVSFFIHTGFLAFLQSRSLWFYSKSTPHVAGFNAPWLQFIDTMPRDKILAEIFEKPAPSVQSPLALHPEPELTFSQLLHPPMTLPVPPTFTSQLPPFPLEQLLTANDELFSVRTFALPTLPPINLFSDLPKDLILPTHQTPKTPLVFHPHLEMASGNSLTANVPSLAIEPPAPSISFSEPLVSSPPVLKEVPCSAALTTPPLPNLPKLPTLADLETVNLSDCFESEIVFLPRENGKGYIFAITFIPRADLDLPKLRQNIFFLIDRSNSIQRDRLIASKSAVEKAINELEEEDTFNVLIFDSKVEKLFPAPPPATPEARFQAEQFLDKISLGSFFSFPDLYKPLLLTIPSKIQDNELYTAILLSDGENLGKKNFQREILNDWTLRNAGQTTLYAVGLNSDPHLATLDAACAFNKGRLFASTTNRGVKRKLLKLIKTIKNPIAKNMATKAIPKSPAATIELFPKSSNAPHLYLGQPYVILGYADTLDDFILFVQGRLKDRWLNIKKNVSFSHARRGGHTLKAEWALKQAYLEYEQYVVDENPQHLEVVKNLLQPFDLQTAFE